MDYAPGWAELLDAYEPYLINNFSKRTAELRMYHARVFVGTRTSTPANVTGPEIQKYVARADWKAATRRTVQGSLLDLFEWAAADNHIPRNPVEKWERVKQPRRVPHPATKEDVQSGLSRASARVRLMIELATEAGLAALEIAALHSDQLSKVNGRWQLDVAGRAGVGHTIYLTPKMAERIRAEGEGFLFPGRIDGHVSPAYVSRLVSQALPPGVTAGRLRQAHKVSVADRHYNNRDGAHYRTDGTTTRLDGAPDFADGNNVQLELAKIARDLESEPGAAIASCKVMLESLFVTVLDERGADVPSSDDLPPLYKKVGEVLRINAESVPTRKDASGEIGKVMRTLTTTVDSLAATRNKIGSHHGKRYVGPAEPRHAFMAFNATVTVAEFVWDTWQLEKGKK